MFTGNADEKDKTETGIPLNSRRRSRRSLETDIGLSPSVAKDLPLDNATLQELLEALMHHKDAWPFLRPVTRADVSTQIILCEIICRVILWYELHYWDIKYTTAGEMA